MRGPQSSDQVDSDRRGATVWRPQRGLSNLIYFDIFVQIYFLTKMFSTTREVIPRYETYLYPQ